MTAVPQPAVRIALFTARFAPVLPAEGFRDIPCQSGSGDDFALRRRGSSQSPGVAVNATDYRFLLLGFCPRFLSGRLELELVGRYRRGLLRRVPDGRLSPAAGDDAINQAVFQRLTRLQDIIAVDIALDARHRLARRCG